MSVVDDIKNRLDIVETVSGYVPLQKSGRYFKAPCPFHTEKTPSFTVNPERQGWHCFGACATGGDVFSFVMRMEGLDFGDALRLLADKTGVPLTSRRDGDKNDVLHHINRVAARFYRDVLASAEGRDAGSYLEQRGVDDKTASTFELGMSPSGWEELKSHLVGLGFAERQAVEAGLLHRAEAGSPRAFFHGRLMFPIHNRRGEVAGFGARALDDSMPKYINTPSTPIFDKRSILYGLHLASEAIRDEGTGIVVEGYMDAMAAHQYDYTNVVASMGTALTDQQVSQLKSSAKTFVLALDPDAAGQEATRRGLESSWRMFERQRVGVFTERDHGDDIVGGANCGLRVVKAGHGGQVGAIGEHHDVAQDENPFSLPGAVVGLHGAAGLQHLDEPAVEVRRIAPRVVRAIGGERRQNGGLVRCVRLLLLEVLGEEIDADAHSWIEHHLVDIGRRRICHSIDAAGSIH